MVPSFFPWKSFVLEASMLKKLAFLLILMLSMIPMSTTDAHSPIEKRFPNVNAVIESAPDQVELFFQDPVQIHRSSVVVQNGNLAEVQVGKPQLDPSNNRRIFVALQKNLPSGKYTVDIDVVAMDGHALKEKYTFEIKVITATPEERFQNLKLERTIPGDGTIVKTSPNRIEIWYNEAVEMPYFGLLDDKQQIVDTDNPTVDPENPKHYVLDLKNELPNGTYAIHSYPRIGERTTVHVVYFAINNLTSITGNKDFSYDELGEQLGVLQFSHWLAYFGLLTLLGGIWFQLLLAKSKRGDESRWQRIAKVLYGLSFLAILLELMMYKIQYSQVVLKDFMSFTFVWITLLQLAAVVMSFLIKKLRFLFLALSVLCWAFIGHSVDPTYGGVWGIGLDFIHLLASSFWIGGLCALFILMPKENPKDWLQDAGDSFSKWALISFMAIGITGIFMSVNYVPAFSFESLILSYWGQMLLIKILLFVVILFFAIWQRKFLMRLTETIVLKFRRNLKIEFGIAVVILLAAGFLVDLSPKEAVQGIYPAAQTKDGITATVSASPLKVGANDITIQLNDDADIDSVRAKFYSNLGGSVENNAFKVGNGLYKLTGNYFHGAGTMNMDVQVIKKNGEKVIYPPFTIQIPGYMPNDIEIENEG
jgi:copper transport protein